MTVHSVLIFWAAGLVIRVVLRWGGRPSGSNRPLLAGMGGASRAFRPMSVLGWGFLHLVCPTACDLMAVSFLVVRPVFSPWRGLVVVTGGWRSLLDGLPQLLVLAGCLPGEVLNAGCNSLHLSLDWGHGRISAGPVIGSSFHDRD